MRTTLTLDRDLAARLEEVAERTGKSVKATVDEILRAGLASRKAKKTEPRPYRLQPASLGGPVVGVDLDKALRLSDALEDEALVAKLRSQK